MKYPRDVTLWDPLKARLIRSNWKKERRDRRLIIVRGINSRKKKLISYNSRKSNSIIPPRGLRKRSDPQWWVLSLSRRLLSTLRGLHHTHRNHCVQTNRFQTFLSLTSHNNNNVVKLLIISKSQLLKSFDHSNPLAFVDIQLFTKLFHKGSKLNIGFL